MGCVSNRNIFPAFAVHLNSICCFCFVFCLEMKYSLITALSWFHVIFVGRAAWETIRFGCVGCVCIASQFWLQSSCNCIKRKAHTHSLTPIHFHTLWATLMICLHCACQRNQHIIECWMQCTSIKTVAVPLSSKKLSLIFTVRYQFTSNILSVRMHENGDRWKERREGERRAFDSKNCKCFCRVT